MGLPFWSVPRNVTRTCRSSWSLRCTTFRSLCRRCAMGRTTICSSRSSGSNCWPRSAAPLSIAAYRTNLEALVAARTQQWKTALSDLKRSYDMTLEALLGALDLKDAETEFHSRRVTAFTMAIAREMGNGAFRPEEIL